jgi:aldehyde:ferredoxin oxidoreductase
MKKVLSVAILAVATLTAGSVPTAKTYEITLSSPTKAGTVDLKAGHYKLKIEGSNAVFIDSKSKSVSTPVKVQDGDKKFDDTRVHSQKEGNVEAIKEIDLGGSKTKLGF